MCCNRGEIVNLMVMSVDVAFEGSTTRLVITAYESIIYRFTQMAKV